MKQTPAHDWMHPRLIELLADAKRVGISKEMSITVLSDLIEGTEFNGAAARGGRDVERRSIGPESEVRGGPEAVEPPEVQTDD
jgi:hypothetical protein